MYAGSLSLPASLPMPCPSSFGPSSNSLRSRPINTMRVDTSKPVSDIDITQQSHSSSLTQSSRNSVDSRSSDILTPATPEKSNENSPISTHSRSSRLKSTDLSLVRTTPLMQPRPNRPISIALHDEDLQSLNLNSSARDEGFVSGAIFEMELDSRSPCGMDEEEESESLRSPFSAFSNNNSPEGIVTGESGRGSANGEEGDLDALYASSLSRLSSSSHSSAFSIRTHISPTLKSEEHMHSAPSSVVFRPTSPLTNLPSQQQSNITQVSSSPYRINHKHSSSLSMLPSPRPLVGVTSLTSQSRVPSFARTTILPTLYNPSSRRHGSIDMGHTSLSKSISDPKLSYTRGLLRSEQVTTVKPDGGMFELEL